MSVRIIGSTLTPAQEAFINVPPNLSSSVYMTPYDITGFAQGPSYTYDVCSTAQFSPTTNTTEIDMFTITNNSSKTYYVTNMSVVHTISAANNCVYSWYLVKRLTPNLAGTVAILSPVPRNFLGPQSSAYVVVYLANPSYYGTTLAGLSTPFLSGSAAFRGNNILGSSTTASQCEQNYFSFDDLNTNPVVVRTGQTLALGFGGFALPAFSLLCHVFATWTEQ